MNAPQTTREFAIDPIPEGAIFRIERPAKLNALTRPVLLGLAACLDELEARGARLLVVTGAGERAFCAGTDNIGLFFGEDVFIALGAVLLIQGFFSQHGIELEPLHIALWALPTAIAAFVIHGLRIVWFGQRLARRSEGAR